MAEQGARRFSPAGAILAIVGAAILIVVQAANVGGAPALEALALRLGLAWAPLLQAFGLAFLLVGVWLLWRGARARE